MDLDLDPDLDSYEDFSDLDPDPHNNQCGSTTRLELLKLKKGKRQTICAEKQMEKNLLSLWHKKQSKVD